MQLAGEPRAGRESNVRWGWPVIVMTVALLVGGGDAARPTEAGGNAASTSRTYVPNVAADSAPEKAPPPALWVVFRSGYTKIDSVGTHYVQVTGKAPVYTTTDMAATGTLDQFTLEWKIPSFCEITEEITDGKEPLITYGATLSPSDPSKIQLVLVPPDYRWHQQISCTIPGVGRQDSFPVNLSTRNYWEAFHSDNPAAAIKRYRITGFSAPLADLPPCLLAWLEATNEMYVGQGHLQENVKIDLVTREDCLSNRQLPPLPIP